MEFVSYPLLSQNILRLNSILRGNIIAKYFCLKTDNEMKMSYFEMSQTILKYRYPYWLSVWKCQLLIVKLEFIELNCGV